jgi:hypothetical protein
LVLEVFTATVELEGREIVEADEPTVVAVEADLPVENDVRLAENIGNSCDYGFQRDEGD